MNHTKRVERHVIVDILAGACGTCGAAAVLQRSWMASILAGVILLALLLLERETIEEEETPTKEDKVKLPDALVASLKKIAAQPLLEYTFTNQEDRSVYDAGALDGSTTLAQYVLEQIQETPNA